MIKGKNIFYYIFLPFFIALNLCAEDNITVEPTTNLISKNLYVYYDEVPSEIYKNQQFEITLKAIITTPLWDRIDTKFDLTSGDFKLYDKSPGWKWSEDNTYYNKYYLKVNRAVSTLPKITISIFNEDFELLEQAVTPPKDIVYKNILGDDKYSGVIASSLKVVSQKTKQYNNLTLMSVIELEGIRSNLEDFHLKEYEQQGIQSFEDQQSRQKLFYKLMIPTYKNKIDFTYYNFLTKRFESIDIPIDLEHELVSTQTDLNPSNSNLMIYKQIGVLVGILVLLIVFYFKRRKFLLFLIGVLLIVFGITFIPNQMATLKSDSNIYILPTKNSTLFQTTSRSMRVEILMKKDEYLKILLPNKTIGWVKKYDIIKN